MYDFLQYDIRPVTAFTVKEVLNKNLTLMHFFIHPTKEMIRDL